MRRRGFTLIELLVIVGIIVVLVGILVPALNGARVRAYKSHTQSLMANLATDCEAYHAHFNSYPGPMGMNNGSYVPTASQFKISGAQNLLLGLSYAIIPNGPAPLPDGISGANMGVGVNLTAPFSVRDYAMTKPDGNPTELSPFFAPLPKQLSATGATVQLAGVFTANGPSNGFKFPVIIDSYPDALPILYYRRTQGVSVPAVADLVQPSGSLPAAGYFLRENFEYTSSASLTSSSGVTFDQRTGGLSSFSFPTNTLVTAQALQYFKQRVATNDAAHGGYFMLSAGLDRIYGTSDDIEMVGGE